MKIGIDIDDTICKSYEKLEPELMKYDKDVLRGNGIIHPESKYFHKFDWTREEKDEFKNKYITNILKDAEARKDALEIIGKLYNEGFEIIYITARNSSSFGYEETKKWLIKNNFPINNLIMDGDEKGEICKENQIDFFIDDSERQCMDVLNKSNSFVIGFNTKENDNYIKASDWYDVYNIIKNNIN